MTPSLAAAIIGTLVCVLTFIYKMRGGDQCNTHSTEIALLNQSRDMIERRLLSLERTTKKTNDIVTDIYRDMPKRNNDEDV